MRTQTKPRNKWISFIADGILSGIMLAIGAMALMSCENRYLGAFLFSLGLFCIVKFHYGLFTGKVGYIVDNKPSYILEVIVTLVSNIIGTCISGLALRVTHAADTVISGMNVTVTERCADTIAGKFSDGILSAFILAFFCGMLMFTAVEAHRKCCQNGDQTGALFGVVMPVFVFIICGFNHCVADTAYYFIAGCPDVGKAFVYFPVAILGNGLGGMLIPLIKKLSNEPL